MSEGLQLVSGGTDNHLMLVDVTSVGLGGKKAEAVLDECGITVNMNMIPFDTRKPMDPSGIRIGTPALTTRGMGIDEMKRVGAWIHQALSNPDDSSVHDIDSRRSATIVRKLSRAGRCQSRQLDRLTGIRGIRQQNSNQQTATWPQPSIAS